MNRLNRVYDMNIAFLSTNYNYFVTSKAVSRSFCCCFYKGKKALVFITDSVLIHI